MSKVRVALLEATLQQHFQERKSVFSPQITDVLADVMRFTSDSFRAGFRYAFVMLATGTTLPPNRPFIEVCDAIVERHIQGVRGEDRDLVGKSLSEAYIYFAGPQNVFEPPAKTRFMQSLRRRGAKEFAAVFLSMHLFNVICRDICEDVAAKMPDQQSYELYMFDMEMICRDVVARAIKMSDGDPDQQWAAVVISNIEAQLSGTLK